MKFLLNIFYRLYHPLSRSLQRLLGYPSLGVRGMVIKDKQVLLVKHTYTPGWHMPGGGVDRNETTVAAVKRELMEEVGVRCISEPELLGIYHYTILGANDYPVVYLIKDFEITNTHSLEIAAIKWFNIDKLPDDIHASTAKRIHEHLNKLPPAESWR